MADAHVPLLDLAGAAQDELVHDHRARAARGEVAVHRVVPVDEEPRVGQADLGHHVAVDEHALEASAVHRPEAALVERRRRERDRDAERDRQPVLPVELAAVVVVAASLDALEPGRPCAHAGEPVGDDLDVVVHEPHPRGAELVRDAHALAEPAGAARVGVEPVVDEFGAETLAVRLDDGGGVIDGGVVDDDDVARLRIHHDDALEQSREEGRTVVGDDRDRRGRGVESCGCHQGRGTVGGKRHGPRILPCLTVVPPGRAEAPAPPR